MGAIEAEERGQLIPDLPEELVLARVVPRLPWYTRPLCRALSKSWRAVLDIRNTELDLRTRMIQLPCTFDKQIFIRDPDIHDPWQFKTYQIQPHWRKLPPLDVLLLDRANMAASSGMVYVWSDSAGLNFVLKLDVGCAEWTWRKFPVPHPFNSEAFSFNDKIYVPDMETSTNSPYQTNGVLVHDMMTDKCRQVEAWNHSNIRVMSKCEHSNVRVEEMYSFVGHEFDPNVEVLMYDVESDSWRTQEKVPIHAMRYAFLFHIMLLNSDCFEPAPERGINIIWVNHEFKSFYWLNSSVGKAWVEIGYNPVLEGRHLDYIESIRGLMCGIFIDEREEEEDTEEDEDGGGILSLSRRTIMKGRVIVASKSVVWEEVHEVGFFHERAQPIDWYTFMA